MWVINSCSLGTKKSTNAPTQQLLHDALQGHIWHGGLSEGHTERLSDDVPILAAVVTQSMVSEHSVGQAVRLCLLFFHSLHRLLDNASMLHVGSCCSVPWLLLSSDLHSAHAQLRAVSSPR